MNDDKVKEISRRLAAQIAEPSNGAFEEWAAALVLTAISMAQFIGTPKEAFLNGVTKNWDVWAEGAQRMDS